MSLRDIRKSVIEDHLPFIKDMLEKVKGTAFEGKWQKTYELVQSGNGKVDQLEKIRNTLIKLKETLKVKQAGFHQPMTIVKTEIVDAKTLDEVTKPKETDNIQLTPSSPKAIEDSESLKIKQEILSPTSKVDQIPQSDVETDKCGSSSEEETSKKEKKLKKRRKPGPKFTHSKKHLVELNKSVVEETIPKIPFNQESTQQKPLSISENPVSRKKSHSNQEKTAAIPKDKIVNPDIDETKDTTVTEDTTVTSVFLNKKSDVVGQNKPIKTYRKHSELKLQTNKSSANENKKKNQNVEEKSNHLEVSKKLVLDKNEGKESVKNPETNQNDLSKLKTKKEAKSSSSRKSQTEKHTAKTEDPLQKILIEDKKEVKEKEIEKNRKISYENAVQNNEPVTPKSSLKLTIKNRTVIKNTSINTEREKKRKLKVPSSNSSSSSEEDTEKSKSKKMKKDDEEEVRVQQLKILMDKLSKGNTESREDLLISFENIIGKEGVTTLKSLFKSTSKKSKRKRSKHEIFSSSSSLSESSTSSSESEESRSLSESDFSDSSDKPLAKRRRLRVKQNKHSGTEQSDDNDSKLSSKSEKEKKTKISKLLITTDDKSDLSDQEDEKPLKVRKVKKRKKTELDKLNEDIMEMFIKEGVLAAQGLRTHKKVSYSEAKTIQEDFDDDTFCSSSEEEKVVKNEESKSDDDESIACQKGSSAGDKSEREETPPLLEEVVANHPKLRQCRVVAENLNLSCCQMPIRLSKDGTIQFTDSSKLNTRNKAPESVSPHFVPVETLNSEVNTSDQKLISDSDIKPIISLPLSILRNTTFDNVEIITIDDDDYEPVPIKTDRIKTELLSPASKTMETAENIVCNLSYFESRNGVTMKCNSEKCNTQTNDEQMFMYHIQTRHLLVKWSGSCKKCNASVSDFGSLLDEFHHMNDFHINKNTPSTSKVATKEQEKPKKRKRGRPKKSESSSKASATSSNAGSKNKVSKSKDIIKKLPTLTPKPIQSESSTNPPETNIPTEVSANMNAKEVIDEVNRVLDGSKTLSKSIIPDKPLVVNHVPVANIIALQRPTLEPTQVNSILNEAPKMTDPPATSQPTGPLGQLVNGIRTLFSKSASNGNSTTHETTSNPVTVLATDSSNKKVKSSITYVPVATSTTFPVATSTSCVPVATSTTFFPVATSTNCVPVETQIQNPLKLRSLPGDKLSTKKETLLDIPNGISSSQTPPAEVSSSSSNSSPVLVIEEIQEHNQLVIKRLRPWLPGSDNKHPRDVASMLKQECLFNMFKCMGSLCAFHTNKPEDFLTHLLEHEKIQDKDAENYRRCAYCSVVGTSSSNLMLHIQSAHKNDQYSCNNCFYRSIVTTNVTNHSEFYHDDKSFAFIDSKIGAPVDLRIAVKEAREIRHRFVLPITCPSCKHKFFLYNAFFKHYSEEHASAGVRNRCNKCNEETNLSTLKHHLENCHNIMQAQCVFCKYGAKSFDAIKQHLMDQHPSKLPLFCERAQESNVSPSSIDSVPIRYIGNPRKDKITGLRIA